MLSLCQNGDLFDVKKQAAFFPFIKKKRQCYCWCDHSPSMCVCVCVWMCESSGNVDWLVVWWLSLLLAALNVIFPLAVQGAGVTWVCFSLCGDQPDPQNSQHTAEVTQADPTRLSQVYWLWFRPLSITAAWTRSNQTEHIRLLFSKILSLSYCFLHL